MPCLLHPFEVDQVYLRNHLEVLVSVTIDDFVSEFMLLPKGESFVDYPDFRAALEVLKRRTRNFRDFTDETVGVAILENSRAFGVLRAILGMTAPEWAELARNERESDVSQNAARVLDRKCCQDAGFVRRVVEAYETRCSRAIVTGRKVPVPPKQLQRVNALVSVAVQYIIDGAPPDTEGVIHRLAKFDTSNGLDSVRHAASEGVPYAVLLYERYLGRPFASHRDSVSELIGDVMENAVEEQLRAAGITFRKTKRAERIPGFDQAPDFCIPDEVSPVVIVEAKITSDDGTARDKVARIKNLTTQRDRQVAEGQFRHYEVVACIDGRGFGERREDMRQMLLALDGKVFTTATLDQLLVNTRLREFVAVPPS